MPILPRILHSWVSHSRSSYWYFCWCYYVWFLISGSNWLLFTPIGLNHLGLHHWHFLEHTYDRYMCLVVLVCDPYRNALSSCCSQWFELGFLLLLKQLCEFCSHLIPLLSQHGGKGSPFLGLVSPDDMVNFEFSDGHCTWGFQCGDWPSGWWSYSHLVGKMFCCLITHWSQVHGEGVNCNPLPTWTGWWGIIPF